MFVGQKSWTLDPKHTIPTVSYSHLGISNQKFRITDVDGKININFDKQTGSIIVNMMTNNIHSSITQFDEHLKGVDLFDSKKYPSIQFKSNNLVWGARAVNMRCRCFNNQRYRPTNNTFI